MWARWAGWGEPFHDYDAPRTPAGQPHPIPEGMDGIRAMIGCCKKDTHRALIGLCGLAGLRVSESLKVRASDFDLRDMMLKVHGKGEKIRYVPVSEELWGVLSCAAVDSFVNNDVPLVGLHDRAARKVVTNRAKDANLQRHVKSHDLRATFATALYNETLDIRLVQAILGHESVETTQIYTGLTQQAMRAAVAKI